MRAKQRANSCVESSTSSPGVIWEIRIQIDVPAGTMLMRKETRPPTSRRMTPLDHLINGPHSTNQQRCTLYRATRSGLVRQPSDARCAGKVT